MPPSNYIENSNLDYINNLKENLKKKLASPEAARDILLELKNTIQKQNSLTRKIDILYIQAENLNHQNQIGIISHENYSIANNKLLVATLEIIDNLSIDDLFPVTQVKNKSRIWVSILLSIIIIIIISLYIKKKESIAHPTPDIQRTEVDSLEQAFNILFGDEHMENHIPNSTSDCKEFQGEWELKNNYGLILPDGRQTIIAITNKIIMKTWCRHPFDQTNANQLEGIEYILSKVYLINKDYETVYKERNKYYDNVLWDKNDTTVRKIGDIRAIYIDSIALTSANTLTRGAKRIGRRYYKDLEQGKEEVMNEVLKEINAILLKPNCPSCTIDRDNFTITFECTYPANGKIRDYKKILKLKF